MACFPKMAIASSPDLHVCLDPGNSSIKRWRLNPLSLNVDGFMTHFDAVWLLRQLLPCLLEFSPWSLGLPCKWSTCIESAMLWGSPTSSNGDHMETWNYLEWGAQTEPDAPAVLQFLLQPLSDCTLMTKTDPAPELPSQPVLDSWSIETLRDKKKMIAMFKATISVTQQ